MFRGSFNGFHRFFINTGLSYSFLFFSLAYGLVKNEFPCHYRHQFEARRSDRCQQFIIRRFILDLWPPCTKPKAHSIQSDQLPTPVLPPSSQIYKLTKFHSANPPATTGVTNLNLFQLAHFLAIPSASPNSFSPARSASASSLSFSGCILSAECRIVVKCIIAATPNNFQSLRASTPSRNTEYPAYA